MEETSFEYIQKLLKGLTIDELEERHYQVAFNGVINKMQESLENKQKLMDLIFHAESKIGETFPEETQGLFPLQSDLFLTLTAFETMIKLLTEEYQSYMEYVIEENKTRLTK